MNEKKEDNIFFIVLIILGIIYPISFVTFGFMVS